jgi:hypothetical protein
MILMGFGLVGSGALPAGAWLDEFEGVLHGRLRDMEGNAGAGLASDSADARRYPGTTFGTRSGANTLKDLENSLQLFIIVCNFTQIRSRCQVR